MKPHGVEFISSINETTEKVELMEKQYVAVIENNADCPVAWSIKETIIALSHAGAVMYADIAAKSWNGHVVSVNIK